MSCPTKLIVSIPSKYSHLVLMWSRPSFFFSLHKGVRTFVTTIHAPAIGQKMVANTIGSRNPN
jgi:hypothetical protein